MKAPRKPPQSLFYPVFESGDLLNRTGITFGSGNQGAGGRVLVSPDGRILLRGPIGFLKADSGDVSTGIMSSHLAGDTRLARLREDVPTLDNTGLFTGWTNGTPTETPGGTLDPGAKVNLQTYSYDTLSLNVKTFNRYYSSAEAATAWAKIKSYTDQLESLSLAPVSPTTITRYVAEPYDANYLIAEERASAMADAEFGQPGSPTTTISASCSLNRVIGAYIFGYHGRRGAVCDFRLWLSGKLTNCTATLRIYRAIGDPTTYLTEEDVDGIMPEWQQVAEFPLTEADNPALDALPWEDRKIVTCPIPGSTLMLATLECTATNETVRENGYHYERDRDGEARLVLEMLPPLKTEDEKK